MRIDTKNKIIYLANPKTGSTSLRLLMDPNSNKYLLNLLKEKNLYNDHYNINIFQKNFNKLNIDNIDLNLKNYFSFTTIRNPWERIVSAFKYQERDKNGVPFWNYDSYDKNTSGQYTFESFLKLCSRKRGEVNASLISSKDLSQPELEKIRKDLSITMGSTLKFEYILDKELIGGLKLQLGSFMIDTSIKNKLKKSEQKMLEN